MNEQALEDYKRQYAKNIIAEKNTFFITYEVIKKQKRIIRELLLLLEKEWGSCMPLKADKLWQDACEATGLKKVFPREQKAR